MIDNQTISDFLRHVAGTPGVETIVPPSLYDGELLSADEALERSCEWCTIMPTSRGTVLSPLDISDVWHRLLREVPHPIRASRTYYSLQASTEAAYSHGSGMVSAFQRNEVLFRLTVRFPQGVADQYDLPPYQIVPVFRASLFDESEAKAHSHTNGRKLYVPVAVYEHMGYFGEVEWTLAYDAQGAPCALIRTTTRARS